mgnify:CR=1 FL=1
MTEYTNYSNFNALTITGRVSSLKLLNGQYGEALAVTMISTLMTDGDEVTIEFTNKNGLMTMFKNGNLVKGMQLTVTGHVSKVECTYIDKKTGVMAALKRPRMTLQAATVFDGGLGPKPKEEVMPSTTNQVVASAPVDAAPTLDEIAF